MSVPRLLIFGSPGDLATPAARTLTSAWQKREGLECVVRDKVPPPQRGAPTIYQSAVFVWKSADEATATRWSQWLGGLVPRPRVVAFVEGEWPAKLQQILAPAKVVHTIEALAAALSVPVNGHDQTAVHALEGLPSLSLSGLQPPPPPLPSSSHTAHGIAELTLVDFERQDALPAPAESTDAGLSIDIGFDAANDPVDDAENAASVPDDAFALSSSSEPMVMADTGAEPDLESEEPLIELAPDASADAGAVSADDILGDFNAPEPASFNQNSESREGTGVPFDPDSEESLFDPAVAAGAVSNSEPVAGHDVPEDLGLWGGGGADAAPAAVPAIDQIPSISFMDAPQASDEAPKLSASAATDELQTLRRYAALREREAREKEAALQALNRQMEQVRERFARSEAERRRLTMALDESEVSRRTLEDELEQTKHFLSKTESAHQEELRAFQLRLDNAQFQASRADRKLEDFRERVRGDIQKIRVRERELANRLELQKRDAEALLAAKDERLLHQKRDIDRLEFELETLRERLLDQTQKAEDRVARLSRALKALKMAQGMLSGIEDEVLPNVDDKPDGGEEAA